MSWVYSCIACWFLIDGAFTYLHGLPPPTARLTQPLFVDCLFFFKYLNILNILNILNVLNILNILNIYMDCRLPLATSHNPNL